MDEEPPSEGYPTELDDLRALVRLGLARGGGLLLAGERIVAERIVALDGPPGRLYARLSDRKPEAFPLGSTEVAGVEDVDSAARALCALDLADLLVPWPTRAHLVPAALLASVCRRHGRPTTGRKADLVARVSDLTGWAPGRWLRIRHRRLLERLLRFAMLDPHPERSTPLLARLGHVRWPEYACTPGTRLFGRRSALLAWEALLRGPLDADGAIEALQRGTARGPGRLDLRRRLIASLRELARERERDDPASAAALYATLAGEGWDRTGRIAVRWARAAELAGDPESALAILARGRQDALPSEQIAIGRAARRLGRTLRAAIPPAIPLLDPPRRQIRLVPAGASGSRPLWETPSGPQPVEAAVAGLLAGLGRRAADGEGAPFATLFAALCADLWFLPVRGALPVPYLPAPLDLGTPGFRRDRADAAARLLDAVRDGRGPAIVAAGDARWRDTRLAGARWDLVAPEILLVLASALGPAGLEALFVALCDRGPRAAAGMPDLVVLPGPRITIPGAFPSTLPEGPLLVEVKGPGDTVRDEQAVWHDRLVRAGVALEVWEVGSAPGSGRITAETR